MTTDPELCHQIFYDNKIYRALIGKGKEDLSVKLYDSLTSHIPTLHNGLYKVHFTYASFLEAIGEGNFREKYIPRLDLTPFLLEPSDIDQAAIEQKLVNAHQLACNYFYHHKELSKDSLLTKIERQLKFSTSHATKFLVADTLVRYRHTITTDFESVRESLAHYLAWDAICGFPFARLPQIPEEAQKSIRVKLRKINEWLLRVFHDRHYQGIYLSSYRLIDKIQKELITSQQFIEQKERENGFKKLKICVPNLLENELKDLGDADGIHLATLGFDGVPGIILTGDTREVLETRLIIQLSVLRVVCGMEASKLELFPGEIYIVDHETGLVKDKILVSEIREDAGIKILIEELESNLSSFVTFKK